MMDFKCTLLVVSKGKPSCNGKMQLPAKDGTRSYPRSVCFVRPVIQDILQQIQIVFHGTQR